MKHLIILIIFCISNGLLAGGGWPQPKGSTYLKLSEWWSIGNQHYTDLGLLDDNVTLGIFNTSLYAEHGITDRLTGIVYFPFFSRTYNNNIVSKTSGSTLVEGDALNGVGDTDLALKYGLTKSGSKIAVSATVLFGIPLGNNEGGREKNLQTGDGEFNQMIKIDAGTGITLGANNGLYANAYTGFNNRTSGFSDEFRVGLEAGFGIQNYKWLFISRLDIVKSLNNGSLPNEINSTSIFANNTEFTSLGFEVNYSIKGNWGVSAGYATALSGKIIIASPSYNVGIFLKL